jgi:hypothetical protein
VIVLQPPDLARELLVEEVADFLGVSANRVHQIARAERRSRTRKPGRAVVRWALSDVLEKAEARLSALEAFIDSDVDARLAVSKRGLLLGMNRAAERLLYVHAKPLLGFDLGATGGIPGLGQGGTRLVFQRGSVRQGRRCVVSIEPVSPGSKPPAANSTSASPELVAEAERLRVTTEKQRGGAWRVNFEERDYPELGGGEASVWARRRDVNIPTAHTGFYILDLNLPPIEADLTRTMVQIELSEPLDVQLHFLHAMNGVAQALATRCMAESCAVFLHRLPEDSPKRRREDAEASTQVVVAHASAGMPPGVIGLERFVVQEEAPSLVADAMRTRVPIAMTWPNDNDDQLIKVRLPNYASLKLNSRFGRVYNTLVVPVHLAPAHSDTSGILFGAIRLVNFYRPGDGATPFIPRSEVPTWAMPLLQTAAQHVALLYRRVLRGAQMEALLRTLESQRWPDIGEYAVEVVQELERLLEFEQVVIWQWGGGGKFTALANRYTNQVVQESDVPEQWSPPQAAVKGLQTILIRKDVGGRPRICGFEVPIRPALAPDEVWGSLGLYNSWLLNESHSAERELKRLAEAAAVAIGARIPPRRQSIGGDPDSEPKR